MKIKLIILILLSVLLIAGCRAVPNPANQSETPKSQISEMDTGRLSGGNNSGDETLMDCPPSVMVDGVIYEDTGYVDSMVTCGTMDGRITSSVDGTKLPTENDQSNFGTGYEYQISAKDQLVVQIDGQYIIFRNIEFKDDSIPDQVLNFKATVKEIKNGSLLVTYVDTAEGFQEMMSGDYSVSAENLSDEVAVGDTVRIWFDGSVAESYPYQLNNVYRITRMQISVDKIQYN